MDDLLAGSSVSSLITPLDKGVGLLTSSLSPEEIVQLNWNLLREEISLPVAVLYEDRLQHNLDWMQQFVGKYGAKLAPHGKTTMAPKLFQRQLGAGAWGITLATAHQTLVAYQHGVRRVLMANQLVGKANMATIARLIHDPVFDYYCLVDSADQVDQLGRFFSNAGCKLNVLLELGITGGRSGVRDDEQLKAVLDSLSRWRGSLALSGVEVYEGILCDEAAIRRFLQRAVKVVKGLQHRQLVQRLPMLLTGAGSAWYDVVAEVFSEADFEDAVEIVLRPGCYLTHDAGIYRDAQTKVLDRNPIAQQMRSGLLPALQVWAYVQSMPEPGLAIIGLGKRDAAFDAGLPMPALHFRPGDPAPKPAQARWTLMKMMDQHAYMKVAGVQRPQIGDMIGFDISHPCLTFDKWRVLPVLNAEYQVVDIVQTFF